LLVEPCQHFGCLAQLAHNGDIDRRKGEKKEKKKKG